MLSIMDIYPQFLLVIFISLIQLAFFNIRIQEVLKMCLLIYDIWEEYVYFTKDNKRGNKEKKFSLNHPQYIQPPW